MTTEQATTRYEEIHKEKAHKYLALSAGNRRINQESVLALAVEMDSGRWVPSGSSVSFDTRGRLIDGHHRLNAVVLCGKTITMEVRRNVADAARGVMDTGTPRSLSALVTMYGSDRQAENIINKRAAVGVCASLVLNRVKAPKMSTMGSYAAWLRPFLDGVEFAINAAVAAAANRNKFRVGAVTGAIAFAHKADPAKVEAFFLKVIAGEGLYAGDPAYTLRNFIMGMDGPGHNSERYARAEKVLSAVFHELKGKQIKTLQAGNVGTNFFRKAHDGQSLARLARSWSVEATPEPRPSSPLLAVAK